MTFVGFDFDEADVGGNGGKSAYDVAAFAGGVEPVAGEGNDADFCATASESFA